MTTDTAVVVLVALALAWETWTLVNKASGDTISESFWRAAIKRPLIPFLLGMLCGHWVWLPERCWELFR